MRVTLTLDADVAERARSLARKRRQPFKFVVNEALRAGLDATEKPAKARPFQVKASPMGLREGYNLDNIAELLAQIEGEQHR